MAMAGEKMRQRGRGRARPAIVDNVPMRVRGVDMPRQGTRTDTQIALNPFLLGPYAQELLKRRVMISPVLVRWTYRVLEAERFTGWLATREILLSESRMSGDAELVGVRYGGTYAIASAPAHDDGAAYETLWGYASEEAMASVHRLCGDPDVSATIIQLELKDFVTGLKRFIASAGDHHFAQDVLVATSAGRG
jgi:hypothetical protein